MFWLYLMVFSTLLPTAIHILIFLFSCLLWPAHRIVLWLSPRLIKGTRHETQALWASILLAAWGTAVCLGGWYVIDTYTNLPAYLHRFAVDQVIALARDFAEYIGAIEKGVG